MANGNGWNNMEALRSGIDRVFEQFPFRPEPFFQTAFLPGRAAQDSSLAGLWDAAVTVNDVDIPFRMAIAGDGASTLRAISDERGR